MLLVSISVAAQVAAGPVTFQLGPELQARYQSPSPGKGATNSTKKAVIGSSKTAIDTGNSKNSFWTEAVDLSGTGVVSNADMLWDGSSRILYAYSQMTLRCTHGKTIDGGILIAIYGKKNFLSKPRVPVGGWWIFSSGNAKLRWSACMVANSALTANHTPADAPRSTPASTT